MTEIAYEYWDDMIEKRRVENFGSFAAPTIRAVAEIGKNPFEQGEVSKFGKMG
jgi:hypothetical protein